MVVTACFVCACRILLLLLLPEGDCSMSIGIRSATVKSLAGLGLLATLLLLQWIGAPAAQAPPEPDPGMEVIRLVNEERAKVKLPPLAYEAALLPVAELRAQESAAKFSHTRPNGEPWSTAFTELGVFGHRGENLAYGQKTPARVVAAWMASTGHRANILNEKYSLLAVGVFNKGGTIYWAQAFLGDPHGMGLAPAAAEPEPETDQAPPPSAADAYAFVKDGMDLNLRAQGNSNAKVLTVMPAGTVVEWLDSKGGWVHVRTLDGLEGWCSEKYLTKM